MKPASFWRRSPHGERGLKSDADYISCKTDWSLPAWGAWIDITESKTPAKSPVSRSPHGEIGLKSQLDYTINKVISRCPHGECGLKFTGC